MLEEHLDSGRPDAWRSAHRILEHHWGKPPEYIAPTAIDTIEVDGMNLDELSDAELVARKNRLRPRRALGEPESAADATPLSAVASS